MRSKKLEEKLRVVYPELTGIEKRWADKMLSYRYDGFGVIAPWSKKQKALIQRIIDSVLFKDSYGKTNLKDDLCS